MSRNERLALVNKDDPMPVAHQCRLLDLNRRAAYRPPRQVSDEDLALMRRIDVLHTEKPSRGARQIVAKLRLDGMATGRNRVRRLMRIMDIRGWEPKRQTSVKAPNHKVFPYLLGNMDIIEPNQVWCSDITYIHMRRGFMYLVAVMDWATRFVLSWRLSNSMGVGFCLDALDDALSGGATPGILNTDQGSQFTSDAFTGAVLASGARMSMDGAGRWRDNVMIERLWRSLKHEDLHGRDLADGLEAHEAISSWMAYYNDERPHSSLDGRTPRMAYEGIPLPPLKKPQDALCGITDLPDFFPLGSPFQKDSLLFGSSHPQ